MNGREGYADFLADIKGRIQTAQVQAALSLSREVVWLYWQIGHEVLARQAQHGWGAGVAEFRVTNALPVDLMNSLPTIQQIEAKLSQTSDSQAETEKQGNARRPSEVVGKEERRG